MDQSGTLRNRVYHRETKMWYDPEMLDDLRNKGQGSLATFMNQPYDAFNNEFDAYPTKASAIATKWYKYG